MYACYVYFEITDWDHTNRPINMSGFEMTKEGLLLFYAFWEVSQIKYDSLNIMGTEYEIGYTTRTCNPPIIPEISSLYRGMTIDV